ncbi:aldehyde dehydrogenase, partial [Streptomyces sp. NPDC057074]
MSDPSDLSDPSGPSAELPDVLRVLNPATEEVVATVPAASAADVDAAVVRVAFSQTGWDEIVLV